MNSRLSTCWLLVLYRRRQAMLNGGPGAEPAGPNPCCKQWRCGAEEQAGKPLRRSLLPRG
jgi:hypothetical protein